MRHSQKQLDSLVIRVNKALNRPETYFTKNAFGANKINIGHIHVESYCPGRQRLYSICETINTGGAIRQPFGSQSHSLSEVILMLETILNTIDFIRPRV